MRLFQLAQIWFGLLICPNVYSTAYASLNENLPICPDGTVVIGNPELHVRKASHRGSKQQQRSCVAISYYTVLHARATHIYCCSSRTSRSWWITQSTQRHRKGCNSTSRTQVWI